MAFDDIEHACARRAGGGMVRIVRSDVEGVADRLVRILEPHFSSVIRTSALGGSPIACADLRSEASLAHASDSALVADLSNVSTYGCAAFRMGADAFVEPLADVTGEAGLVVVGLSQGLLSNVPALGQMLGDLGDSPEDGDLVLLERGLLDFGARRRSASDCAQTVAEFLRCHPGVARVWYPGLKGDSTHEVASVVLQSGFGPIVDFELARGFVVASPGPSCLERVTEELLRVMCWDVDPKTLVLTLERALSPSSDGRRNRDASVTHDVKRY